LGQKGNFQIKNSSPRCLQGEPSMNRNQFLLSACDPGKKHLWILFVIAALANFSFAQSGAGTLASNPSTTTTSGDCTERITTYTWTFTDSLGKVHTFPNTTGVNAFETCSASCSDGRTKSSCFTGCGCPPSGSSTQDEWSTDGQYYLQATGGSGTVSTLFAPLYKVVSILYSPPGNQSFQGFANTVTNGTSTTYGQSFSFSEELTFSSGIPDIITGSASTGFSVTTSNSEAFTQTWTDATSIASNDNANTTWNPTKSDTVNHNLDTFVLWLNPRVSVIPNGTNPVRYTVGSQNTPGVSALVADIVLMPALTMEATPPGSTGVSTVPIDILLPQAIPGENGQNSYMPGLGAICKNNTLYKEQLASANPSVPSACTQANQCGCTPSDFVAILQMDPLLNYNGTTLTADPYPGSTSPLQIDVSGESTCAENPVPSFADCRYVIVPIEKGSTTTTFEALSGAEQDSFTQSDATTTTETVGGSTSFNVGVSISSGPFWAMLKVMDMWQWSDSESMGTSSSQGNSMSVTFKTSTASCEENVNIYEDTVYHSYVFQTPLGSSCP
jgi:hypothetical protein